MEAVAAAFPQLEIQALIGQGGMAAVYRARQLKLDRLVALKLMAQPAAGGTDFTERFHREARVLARLNHPGIVSVFDYGEAGGFFYLLMEYVDGVNLRQAMKASRFTPAQALALVPRICEALQFAHNEGILHRDIKPENILLDTRGRLKIADFGIAKLLGDRVPDTTLTAQGLAVGTPNFMAPEQLEHPGDVDQRADIYSLGVVFYEMLTGELPLGRFAPPSQKTSVDALVDEVVLRALERERERRYHSAGEMKTEVEGVTPSPGAVGGAGGPVRVAKGAASKPDFLLCHPRLPKVAQAIVAYAVLVVPFLWALSVTLRPPQFIKPETPASAHVLEAAWSFLGEGVGRFLTMVMLVAGGLKLRVLRSGGPRWLRAAIWLRLWLIVLGVIVTTWVMVLEGSSGGAVQVGAGSSPTASSVLLALWILGTAFEFAMLVWLRRNRTLLDDLCVEGVASPPEVGPSGTVVLERRADPGPHTASSGPIAAARPSAHSPVAGRIFWESPVGLAVALLAFLALCFLILGPWIGTCTGTDLRSPVPDAVGKPLAFLALLLVTFGAVAKGHRWTAHRRVVEKTVGESAGGPEPTGGPKGAVSAERSAGALRTSAASSHGDAGGA
ncbi:MAG: serine/threonine protein kinase [Verrucomicrobiae bacterium]|nr:serine/threonine protein kinase [Verrucomicrobiae bacterium]